jgi:uncharacterized alkaline shock family protein YloU
MPQRPVKGRSAVTRRAITDIVRTAVRGSYGVSGFATPIPVGHLVRALGLGEPGIRLSGHDPLTIGLHLRVAYGLPVAEVARQVDSAVRYAIHRDLGLDVADLTIHVDGLEYRPGRIPELPLAADGPGQTAADARVAGVAEGLAVPDPNNPADHPGADPAAGADVARTGGAA